MKIPAEAATTVPIELQIATIIVAGIAAVAAVVAAVITAMMAARRDRNSWLRQQQTESYEHFSDVAHAAVDEVVSGAVDYALHLPHFPGLDASWDALGPRHTAINNAVRRLIVIGEKRSMTAAVAFAKTFGEIVPMAYPLSGAAHKPATELRLAVFNVMIESVLNVDMAFRADLNVMSRGDRRRFDTEQDASSNKKLALTRRPDDGHAALLNWRVRDWDYQEVGDEGWLRSDYPWSTLHLYNNAVFQPLVGMLTKVPDLPWRAAIASGISKEAVGAIETDMFEVARYGGRGGQTLLGGQHWIEGQQPGERIWFWTEADLQSTSLDAAPVQDG